MTLTARIAGSYQWVAKAVVTINPINLLTPWLLRNAPMLWRTQVGLVVSYAALSAVVLYLWGRSVPVTFEGASSEIDLQVSVWWTSSFAFALLTPWLIQNIRTKMDSRKAWSAPALFVCYLACLGAINFVPTAYLYGRLEAIADLHAGTSQVDVQQLWRAYNEIYDEEGDYKGFRTDPFKKFTQFYSDLDDLGAPYGVQVCATLNINGADMFILRGLFQADLDEFNRKRVCGKERIGDVFDQFKAISRFRQAFPFDRSFADYTTARLDSFGYNNSGVRVDVLWNEKRVVSDLSLLFGSVWNIAAAKDMVSKRAKDVRHPFNPFRLLAVLITAFVMTSWSLRGSGAPGKGYRAIRGIGRFATRALDFLTRPRAERYRSGPIRSAGRLIWIAFPYFAAMFALGSALLWVNITASSIESDILSQSLEDYSELYARIDRLALIHYGIEFLVLSAFLLVCIALSRVFAISDITEIHCARQVPHFATILTSGFVSILVVLFSDLGLGSTITSVVYSLAHGLLLLPLFLSEKLWFDRYDASRISSRAAGGVVRNLKSLTYFLLFLGIGSLLILVVVLLGQILEYAFSLSDGLEALLVNAGLDNRGVANHAIAILSCLYVLAISFLAGLVRKAYLNENENLPWSMPIDRIICLSLAIAGTAILAAFFAIYAFRLIMQLVELVRGPLEFEVGVVRPEQWIDVVAVLSFVATTGLAMVFAYFLLGWFLKDYHEYWDERIFDPDVN